MQNTLKRTNSHVMIMQEKERQKGTEKILKEIMAETTID